MTTQTEALKLALEALEQFGRDSRFKYEHQAIYKTIVAIKEALAQPEQEPVAFLTNHRQRMNVQIKPEAFVWMPTTTDWEIPLYTTPPQRTWVGLMDEELKPICDEYRIIFGSWSEDFSRAIEAKLRSKNGY